MTCQTSSIPLLMVKILLLWSLLIGLYGCEDPVTSEFQPDSSIVFLPNEFELGLSSFFVAVWPDSNIYYAGPLRMLALDSAYKVVRDSTLTLYQRVSFLYTHRSKKRLLYVASSFTTRSEGSLYELDRASGSHTLLLDSSYHVSSAVYTPDNTIIYYSYGNTKGLKAGYYEFQPGMNQHTLLIPFLPRIGISSREPANGFDIHPDGKTLLLPFDQDARVPVIARYDRDRKTLDTLVLPIDSVVGRSCFWLRYNSTGSKILYSYYPYSALGDAVWTGSEIGIIDIATGWKKVIPIRINRDNISVNIFPSWSPNEKDIIFGSAPVTPASGNVVGLYSVAIKKNVLD
jgi:hypothetical protein